MVVDGITNLNTRTTFDFDILANQEISIRMDLDKSASQICTGSYIVGSGLNRPNNQELPGSDLNGSTNEERCTGSDLNGSTNQKRCTGSDLNGSTNRKRCTGSDLNKPTNQEKCTARSDLNGSINRERCTQSNLNASIVPERCDESDLNGSTKQEKCSVSDSKRLTDDHSDKELDSNGLNNHNEDTNLKRINKSRKSGWMRHE